MSKHTVYSRDAITGRAHFHGPYLNLRQAIMARNDMRARYRKTPAMEYEIWEGTPDNPIRLVDETHAYNAALADAAEEIDSVPTEERSGSIARDLRVCDTLRIPPEEP